jgi:hypothetical protein
VGRFGGAEVVGRIAHLGQQRARDVEQRQQLVVPVLLDDVEQQGPAGVGGVGGMDAPARQTPDEPAIDGTEGELAFLGARLGAVDVVEQPAQLGRGEVRIQQEPAALRDQRLVAGGLELAAILGRAPILPDDGVVDRLARAAIPDKRRLALVGDAEGDGPAAVALGLLQRLPGDGDGGLPQVLGVVLDPAATGLVLTKLLLRRPDGTPCQVVNDGPGAGGALVDGEDAFAHGCGLRRVSLAAILDWACQKSSGQWGMWAIGRSAAALRAADIRLTAAIPGERFAAPGGRRPGSGRAMVALAGPPIL